MTDPETIAGAVPPRPDPELLARLHEALATLPARLREAVILRHLEGRDLADAARLADCPVGTLAWRTSAGLERLRRRLASAGLTITTSEAASALDADHAPHPAPGILAAPALRFLRSGDLPASISHRSELAPPTDWNRFAVPITIAISLAAVVLVAALVPGARSAERGSPASGIEKTPNHRVPDDPSRGKAAPDGSHDPTNSGGTSGATDTNRTITPATSSSGVGSAPPEAPRTRPLQIEPPTANFRPKRSAEAWPELPPAAELRGLRRFATSVSAPPGTPVGSMAAGTLRFAASLADATTKPRWWLVVVEHDAAPLGRATPFCSILLFPGSTPTDLTAGRRLETGSPLGRLNAASTATDAARFVFALRDGPYLQASPPFLARWRTEALALAHDAGIPTTSPSDVAFVTDGEDAIRATVAGQDIVSISLLRRFCSDAPIPLPLADWCFDPSDDPAWLDPEAFFR